VNPGDGPMAVQATLTTTGWPGSGSNSGGGGGGGGTSKQGEVHVFSGAVCQHVHRPLV
jgi:hypothetical protein